MWTRCYLATAAFAALVPQLPLPAQECDPSHGRRPPHLAHPYTAEYRERVESTDYAGKPNPVQEDIHVVAQDLQGRRLYRWTTSDGSSHSQVFDPVTAEEMAWNTSSKIAKILKSPAPVAGRPSCWRGPDSEKNAGRDEPRVTVSEFACVPAGQHQTGCRDACRAVLMANALPPEKKGFPKCASAEPKGTAEDLGTDVIQGVAAHGCRTTTPFPKGKRKLVEIWSDDDGLSLRRIEEGPNDFKHFSELISLSREEPSPSTFQPPEGYEVVRLQMDEVSCETPGPWSQ